MGTWDDAREVFRSVCEGRFEKQFCATAEQQMFEGYPTGDVDLTINENFCARLMGMLDIADDVKAANEHKTALVSRAETKVETSDTKELDRVLVQKGATTTTTLGPDGLACKEKLRKHEAL